MEAVFPSEKDIKIDHLFCYPLAGETKKNNNHNWKKKILQQIFWQKAWLNWTSHSVAWQTSLRNQITKQKQDIILSYKLFSFVCHFRLMINETLKWDSNTGDQLLCCCSSLHRYHRLKRKRQRDPSYCDYSNQMQTEDNIQYSKTDSTFLLIQTVQIPDPQQGLIYSFASKGRTYCRRLFQVQVHLIQLQQVQWYYKVSI